MLREQEIDNIERRCHNSGTYVPYGVRSTVRSTEDKVCEKEGGRLMPAADGTLLDQMKSSLPHTDSLK